MATGTVEMKIGTSYEKKFIRNIVIKIFYIISHFNTFPQTLPAINMIIFFILCLTFLI